MNHKSTCQTAVDSYSEVGKMTLKVIHTKKQEKEKLQNKKERARNTMLQETITHTFKNLNVGLFFIDSV